MQVVRSLIVVTVMLTARAAVAGGIVLESYTGPRPDDAARLVAPVLDELRGRGFVSGYDAVGAPFEKDVSKPAIVLQGLPIDFAAQVQRGEKAWIDGRFDDAIKILAPLVDAVHDNAGAFAENQSLLAPTMRAVIALALSHDRRGDPSAARTVVGEFLRSFPNEIISKGTYGPEAFQLYEQVKRDAGKNGLGRLTVKVENDGGVVFVDEHIEQVGTTTKANLVPGEYRVFAQTVTKQVSRVHRVVVGAGQDVTVTIDPVLDQVVHSGPRWTGLTFGSGADRERLEGPTAAGFAKAVGATAIAVVGIDQVHGHPALIGALINRQTGREIRRASLALEPPPPVDRVRALARFLGGDEAVKGIDVLVNGETAPDPKHDDPVAKPDEPVHRDEPRDGLWPGFKWIAGGVAVGALGTGGVLLFLDGRCPQKLMPGQRCPNVYDLAAPGWLTVGGGAVVAAVAVYLFVRDSGSPSRSAYVTPTQGGAIAGFTSRF
jgi:hypothetical protein